MDFLPYYILLGVAIGFVAVLVLRNLRLALQYLVMVGKVAAILFVLMLFGGLIGWWDLPRPLARFFTGLRRLWQPLQATVLAWFQRVFR